jgi:NhaP-type Na+/H+ or K+/H+ antiporter
VPFVEETGALVSVLVWLAFGAVALVPALLALEELGSPAVDRAVAIIAITVLLSVVAHGATAEPLAAWYAKLLAYRAASGRAPLRRTCQIAG